jgi:dephospho-CoA kinase
MKILGITGSIATGVSTVAGLFALQGAKVIHADDIAVLALHDATIKKKLMRAFGNDILFHDTLNKQLLAGKAFSSQTAQQKLVKITHPFILREIKKQQFTLKKMKVNLVVVDAPLLFESKLDKIMDFVIVVSCSKRTQEKRLKKKHFSLKEAKRRLRFQKPLAWKKKHADFVIVNESMFATKTQVKKMYQSLVNEYHEKSSLSGKF